MKKYLTQRESKTKRNLPHFHPIVSIMALVFGILGTLFVTHVLAQVTNTTIYACVNKSSGALHIVDANTTCANNETLLTWNQQGPQGIQGPPGPAGTGGNEVPLLCPGCRIGDFGDDTNGRFKGKDFSDSYISSSRIPNVDFTGTNFSRAVMREMAATKSNFTNDKFVNALLEGSNFTQAILVNADLTGASLNAIPIVEGAGVFQTKFNDANAMGANFTNVNARGIFFTNTNLTNANFTGADLSDITLTDRFGNTATYHTDFTGATLTGVIWSNTKCPNGTNSDDPQNNHSCVNAL